jgi:hypothetical protein
MHSTFIPTFRLISRSYWNTVITFSLGLFLIGRPFIVLYLGIPSDLTHPSCVLFPLANHSDMYPLVFRAAYLSIVLSVILPFRSITYRSVRSYWTIVTITPLAL